MKRYFHIICSMVIFILYAASIHALTLRIISKDSNEPLPFSIIRLPNIGVIRTDTLGIANINQLGTKINDIYVSSFGYETQHVSVPLNQKDTFYIRLNAAPFKLEEAVVKPLRKDKDIVNGRCKHSFGIFNTTYLNIYPEYGVDSISGHIYQYEPGIEFKAPKGKMNRLNAFGINILPTDSMIKELVFSLNIYDMSGHNPEDTISIPNLAHAPIKIRYKSELVDFKNKEFKYVFPEPIYLPDDCMIVVGMTWYDENNVSFLDGKYLKVLTTNNCLQCKEGNPYKALPGFIFKKLPSPFFFELTRFYKSESL